MKYKTHGTCSREILFDIDDNGIVTNVEFVGGCRGNTQGVAKLAVGRSAKEVSEILKGIECRNGTSCPDQLSKALEEYLANK